MRSIWIVLLAAVIALLVGGNARAAASGHPVQVAVAAIENRFMAVGTILDARQLPTGIYVFRIKIEKVGEVRGFANLGTEYQGVEKEFLSEIGAPPALAVGKRVSVILRVSGDERHQELFLVEVRDHEHRN